MLLHLRLALAGSLALLFATGWLMGQDEKKVPEKESQSHKKAKGSLPRYFSQLGLTEDQRQNVLKVHGAYKAKIDALREQIAQLTGEEKAELNKILSETQRIRLHELRSRESEPTKEAPTREEKKEESKKQPAKDD